MTEDQLLSGVVLAHSQQHPQKRGQLFHPANERNHALQAMQAKAKGIYKGVSDLIYFEINGLDLRSTIFIGVELKVVGSRHERHTVEAQVEWGETLEGQGGHWRLCTNKEDALACFEFDFKGFTTKEVRAILAVQKTKTIKF
ncbi:MAG: hypothetical protein V4547_16430 [Bacteroidota bacterium]